VKSKSFFVTIYLTESRFIRVVNFGIMQNLIFFENGSGWVDLVTKSPPGPKHVFNKKREFQKKEKRWLK
jgi:hypothetical protein